MQTPGFGLEFGGGTSIGGQLLEGGVALSAYIGLGQPERGGAGPPAVRAGLSYLFRSLGGGRQDGERAPTARPGAGQGRAGGGRVRAVPGAGGAGDRGERGDLRGQAAGPAGQRPPCAGGGKGGLCEALAAEAAAEIGRLAAAAAGSLAAGAGLEAVELAIRTAVTRLGGGMLERLLAADPGYRGPETDCGAGHQAEFVSYRARPPTRCPARSP